MLRSVQLKASEAGAADLSSIRLAISAAEILSAEVFNSWKRLSGLEIIEGLGSTEVLHIYLSNTAEKKKLGSAGLRVPGYEIVLRDQDGRDVAADGLGESTGARRVVASSPSGINKITTIRIRPTSARPATGCNRWS